jgi:hypothetical protein
VKKSWIMIGAVWNIRGLNKTGRIKCLSDFIKMNSLDLVGIQQTKKIDISTHVLTLVNKAMDWKFLPAEETAG